MAVFRYQWEISGIGSGGPGLMTFHHEMDAGTTDPGTIGNPLLYQADFITAWSAYAVESVVFTPPSEASQIDTTPETFVPISEAVTPIAGTAAGQALPWQTQLVVSWVTAVRTRSGQGRTFLPGASTQFTSAGRPDSFMQDAMRDAGNALVSASNAGSTLAQPLVVWSRTDNAAYPVLLARVRGPWSYLSSRRD